MISKLKRLPRCCVYFFLFLNKIQQQQKLCNVLYLLIFNKISFLFRFLKHIGQESKFRGDFFIIIIIINIYLRFLLKNLCRCVFLCSVYVGVLSITISWIHDFKKSEHLNPLNVRIRWKNCSPFTPQTHTHNHSTTNFRFLKRKG